MFKGAVALRPRPPKKKKTTNPKGLPVQQKAEDNFHILSFLFIIIGDDFFIVHFSLITENCGIIKSKY